MNRKRMPTRKDHKIYTQTARSIKKINIKPMINRGGIRL